MLGTKIHLLILVQYYFYEITQAKLTIHGRYTRDIEDYQLTIPRKLTSDGDFKTFEIPHFYEHDFGKRKRKRSLEDPNLINYGVFFNGAKHHIQLWPNHAFVAPSAVFENRNPKQKVSERKLRTLDDQKMCHYTGLVRDQPGTRVALSTCDGLAGYIMMNGQTYFIEPVLEHVANSKKQHMHIVYQKREADRRGGQCGTSGNWQDAWAESFRRKLRQDGTLSPRGLKSSHRYLETLVVCDKKFIEFHRNGDIESYVLTIMNMVADFYHDPSSGNQMDVVVVRVIYLEKEEEEIDLVINPDAEKSLASFCKWQQSINPKELENPNHHDIAVLLTRHDICADNLQNCGLMGLAYVATPCSGDKPCAINEDAGLVLAIVVAHEMGHVMGCSHDKPEESGCKSQDENEYYYVMSPFVHLDTAIWSTCSKEFITNLFDNDLGECLNDEPENTMYGYKNVLPGVVYSAEEQCKIIFPNSTLCGPMNEGFCKELVCQTDSETCLGNGEPAADGTKCGENKWCYRKKCIEMGQRPEAVNGGWGEWGGWSECSRTCGAGVSYSTRECNNPVPQHQGRYCLGERKKMKICKPEPCAEGSKSFRAIQCSEFDKKPFKDKLYTWEPFFQKEDPCALYCLNSDKIFVKMAPRAKDGTRCKLGTKNMCVSGTCRKVGCDFELDSAAVEDACGVCKGDGTQCKIVDEIYKAPAGHDYVKVARIPKGSRNVLVEELKPSDNTIAISGPDEKTFHLNGGHMEMNDGMHPMGGVEGLYAHPEPNKENLAISGPLKEDIVLFVVFFSPENVGYHYKYSETVPQPNYQPHYHWEFVEWDECTVRCGGGVQLSPPDCLEDKAGKVTPSFCEKIAKPEPMKRKCSEHPCKSKWRVGKWGQCNACKLESGVRIREVECVRENPVPGEEDVLVEDKECTEVRPGTRELCDSHKTCSGRRRQVDPALSPGMMQNIWLQTLQDPVFETYLNNIEERQCGAKPENEHENKQENTHAKGKKPDVGKVIKDYEPESEIKLKVIPMKPSHVIGNLSDEGFQSVGDKIQNTLDEKKEQKLTGKQAVEKLKEVEAKLSGSASKSPGTNDTKSR